MLQQIPLTVIAAPPLLVIFPPLMAVVCVIPVTVVVERVGILCEIVLKVNSSP